MDYRSMLEVPVDLLTPKANAVGNEEECNPVSEVEETTVDLHQEAISGKGKRVARLNQKRKMKAYKEIKVPANGVCYTWFGTHNLKKKVMLTPQQIKKAKRAERKYQTEQVCYTFGKARYKKNHSRAKEKSQAMFEANS